MTWESFQRAIPSSHYWPIDSYWNYHCGYELGDFGTLARFTPPLNARFGNATGVQDYLEKSQVMAYEGHRAMFEGYGRNKYTATGVIQWMLNNAYTQLIWHLYDFYLNNGGAYFGTKKACEPVHIQYSYDDASIWVVNSWYTEIAGPLSATAEVFNLKGVSVWNNLQSVSSLSADSATKLFTIQVPNGITTTYFLRLKLYYSTTVVSSNFYFLSTKSDTPEWNKSTWYNTPCKSYADFTELQTLPAVTLTTKFNSTVENGQGVSTVTVTNPTNTVAFFIRLRITDKNGADALPIIWNDNYVTLMPGEVADFVATYPTVTSPQLVVETWNNISGGK